MASTKRKFKPVTMKKGDDVRVADTQADLVQMTYDGFRKVKDGDAKSETTGQRAPSGAKRSTGTVKTTTTSGGTAASS